MKRAEELASRAQYNAAYAVLDGAYHQLLYAIKGMRDRQTLEYRLNFASPQEEFVYEQRRYLSQMMLLEMAIAEHMPDARLAERLRYGMAEAASHHAEADKLAAVEQYQEALARGESATAQLQGLLRLMGYFF